MSSGRCKARLALAAWAILLTLAASRAAPAQEVDLANFSNGFRIDGANQFDKSGVSVSGAGDVNGDGLADLIVGATGADPGGETVAGSSYVVFGKTGVGTVNLANISSAGFRIDGVNADDFSGNSVSGAGDVNGDGLADLIVGAVEATPGGETAAGSSYVVFGKTDTSPVDLDNLTDNGFRIDGGSAFDLSGSSVSGAGDVNGDGLADLIVGATGADPGGEDRAGSSYVVFGKTDGSTIDLAALGSKGFRIDGGSAFDRSGNSVSGAGDVNGDGLADLIIGAQQADPGGEDRAGSSYVVFGKTDSSTVPLAALGFNGFRIDGVNADDFSGNSVSGAGDVNGDGLADLIIGAQQADPGGEPRAGSSYVVFGKADSLPVRLASLSNGFRIDGVNANDRSGFSVSGAGDVNGDGLADLIVGAITADPGGETAAGSSYVVFGKTGVGTVNLANISSAGFRIDGVNADDFSGNSVSGAGDVNGDGLADLIVGARNASPGGEEGAGSSYVVFSEQTPSASATYRGSVARPVDVPRLAIGTTGDGSNASHPDSRVWIDFADGFLIDGRSVSATRMLTNGNFTSAAANVSWELASNRLGWTSAELRFRYLDTELTTGNETLLQLVHSADGNAPFTPLTSVVNPLDNTISANVSALGFFYLGDLEALLFSDGFED